MWQYRVTTELLPGYKISQQIRADFIAHSYYVLNLPFRTSTFPYISNCSWLSLPQSTPRMFTYNVVCGFPQAIFPYLYEIQIYLDSLYPQQNPGLFTKITYFQKYVRRVDAIGLGFMKDDMHVIQENIICCLQYTI